MAALRHRQRTDVIVVGVGDDDRIQLPVGHLSKIRRSRKANLFWVHASVQHYSIVSVLKKVAIGTDLAAAR